MRFLQSKKFNGFLSFAPDAPVVDLTPLNVLIGPNASGKSNFIEAIELLHATPTGPQHANTQAFRQLTRDSLVPDESVLSQRKDPELSLG